MTNANYTLWDRAKRWTRFQYLRIMRASATPYSVAMGLAAGIFAGFLPIVPLQTVTVICICLVVRGNAMVGFIGTWISNPFNWVPFYYFLYVVGKAIVPWDPPDMSMDQFSALISDFDVRSIMSLGKDLLEAFKIMLIAGFILGSIAAPITYFVTHRAVTAYRKKRALKLLKKRTRL